MTDADGVTGMQAGDHEAFRALIEAHQEAIIRFCRRYTGSKSVAADLCQEVFVTLWQQRHAYRHDGRLRPYLMTIARYRCLAHVKQHGRLVPLENDERQGGDRADRRTLGRQLEQSLGQLEPEQAEVVVLRYLEELELKEIAELTGQPLGTVKSRLHRALSQLRRVWHVD